MNILDFSKYIIKNNCREDNICIDFTMGNGYDSLFLSILVPKGFVYSFDIQKQAIENTKKLFLEKGMYNNIEFIEDGHENFDKYVKNFNIGIYNLGYLPKGNKNITTKKETTIESIKKSIYLLEKKGIICITIYRGHGEGFLEGIEIEKFIKNISKEKYEIYRYENIKNDITPYVIIIKRNRL